MSFFILFILGFNTISKAQIANNQTSEIERANEKISCEEVKLNIKRSKSIRSLTQEFKSLPRDLLISGLWYELKNPSDSKSLVLPLLYFLSGTENEKNLRGFYKTTLWLLVDSEEQEKILKLWPKRPSVNTKHIDKNKLCELYLKTQEGFKK